MSFYGLIINFLYFTYCIPTAIKDCILICIFVEDIKPNTPDMWKFSTAFYVLIGVALWVI